MNPLFDFDYWGLPVYHIMGAGGVLCAYLHLRFKLRAVTDLQKYQRQRMNICVKRSFWVGLLFALVVANIANWFFHPDIMLYPILLRIRFGGLAFFPGMLAFFGVSALLLKLHRQDCSYWIHEAVPAVLIFHAVGRVGCSLVGCCYGVPVSLFEQAFRFPAREIEAIFSFVLYFVFTRKVIKARLPLYLLSYSILRFVLEFGRGDNRGALLGGALSPAQIISIAVCIAVVAYIIIQYQRKVKFTQFGEDAERPHVPEDNRKTSKLLRIIAISAFVLVMIFGALAWWNPHNVYWLQRINIAASNLFSGASNERSTVVRLDDRNIEMVLRDTPAVASIEFASPNDRQYLHVHQRAGATLTFALNFDDLIDMAIFRDTGELLTRRTVLAAEEFRIYPTGRSETHKIVVTPSSANPSTVMFSPFEPLAVRRTRGYIVISPRRATYDTPAHVLDFITTLEAAYERERARTLFNMIYHGECNQDMVANFALLYSGVRLIHSCAVSCELEGYDSIDRVIIAEAIFDNGRFLEGDIPLRYSSLNIEYIHSNVMDYNTTLYVAISVLDIDDNMIDFGIFKFNLIRATRFEDVPLLGPLTIGYFVNDIQHIDGTQAGRGDDTVVIQPPSLWIADLGLSRYFVVCPETNHALRPSYHYDHSLATLAAELSAVAYGREYGAGRNRGADIREHIEDMGFETIFQRNYVADPRYSGCYHVVAYTIAHKRVYVVEDGNNIVPKNLIFVVISGTNSSQWHSNFYIRDPNDHDARIVDHYGFRTAADRLRVDLNYFMRQLGLYRNQTENVMLITGHSRGGSVANLLGADLSLNATFVAQDNLHVYTFAAPNTTAEPNADFTNIFNIVHAEDFAVYFPLTLPGWDFGRHGVTLVFPSLGMPGVSRDAFNARFYGRFIPAFADVSGQAWVNYVSYDHNFGIPFYSHNGYAQIASLIIGLHSNAPTIYDHYNTIPTRFSYTSRQFLSYVADTLADGAFGGLFAELTRAPGFAPYRGMTAFLVDQGIRNTRQLSQHHENYYLAWMMSLDGRDCLIEGYYADVRTGTFFGLLVGRVTRIRIACPVDVRIYNDANVLLARVVDNKDESIFSEVFVSIDEDVKYFYVNSNNVFTVRITATATGTMSYSVEVIDVSTAGLAEHKAFENVNLYEGRELVSFVSQTADVRLLLAQGAYAVGEIAADGSESAFDMPQSLAVILGDILPDHQNNDPFPWLLFISSVVASLLLFAVGLMLLLKRKTKPAPPTAPAAQPRMTLIFLLDTSAAARPYITELNAALNRFRPEVSRDMQTDDILDVAVIRFGDAHYSAPIREALRVAKERRSSQSASYKPWVVLVADSAPGDSIDMVANEIQNAQNADELRFLALSAQGRNVDVLKRLTDVVFQQDGDDFTSFFDWICKCMWAIAHAPPNEKPQLPPLQGNVYRTNKF